MHANVLDPESTVLLVVDVQERFRPAILGFDDMTAACARLIRTFGALELPILVTEQYPKGLGRTVPEVREALESCGKAHVPVLEKTSFSACCAPAFWTTVSELQDKPAVLVCGIETHVCVQQTVHDLLVCGHRVQVAVDAVSSRRASDRDVALRKMERSGAVLTTSEIAAFELLRDATHPRFKAVQALYK